MTESSRGDNDETPPLARRTVKRQLTQLAAGHGGENILKHFSPNQDVINEIPDCIMKTYNQVEADMYKKLEASKDPLLRFTARYYGEVDPAEVEQSEQRRYIKLKNLLQPFDKSPHVMDCKLGIRSFMEEEVSKRTEPRADLYAKMVKMDASAPTDEERRLGAITKHRYHAFKESFTSLKTLGFRIEGIAHSGAAPASAEELQNVHSIHDAATLIFKWFLPTAGKAQGQQLLEIQNSIVEKILASLQELKATMVTSPFAQAHSFVASSLIFITEAFPVNPNCTRVGVHLVDFSRFC